MRAYDIPANMNIILGEAVPGPEAIRIVGLLPGAKADFENANPILPAEQIEIGTKLAHLALLGIILNPEEHDQQYDYHIFRGEPYAPRSPECQIWTRAKIEEYYQGATIPPTRLRAGDSVDLRLSAENKSRVRIGVTRKGIITCTYTKGRERGGPALGVVYRESPLL